MPQGFFLVGCSLGQGRRIVETTVDLREYWSILVRRRWAVFLVLLAVGFLFMVGAALQQGGDPSIKTSMVWLVGAYFFHTMGELCLSPIGLSMVTKLAPLRLASLMMGAWFGFVALANYAAGFIGSFIGHGDTASQVDNALAIFGGIAITAAFSGLVLFLLSNKLIDWMHGAEGATVGAIIGAGAMLFVVLCTVMLRRHSS